MMVKHCANHDTLRTHKIQKHFMHSLKQMITNHTYQLPLRQLIRAIIKITHFIT